ncbi:hypothetical protein [Telluribacter sp. SYSU D00476]|uniref:hypothetical protein n=1 Tax=Telluribacter sp. SYSU D00476 TaxID=2811430 RepID=UPI001FF54473|nr:hypothetical protein [Telluribacter sp. SYSU D00476]
MRRYFNLLVPFLFIVYISNEIRLASKLPDDQNGNIYLQVGVLLLAIGIFVYRLVRLGKKPHK